MKKILGTISLVILHFYSFSQEGITVNMPSILPASPEASALNKGGQLAVGMYSGAAQASIPIHQIKLSSLTMPISLDYASNGSRVDEIPSRTGLGWTLNAGGVVTRIVHGAPDDQTTRLSVPGNPTMMNSDNLLFYQRITSPDGSPPLYDAEPDEFRYNAPGLSGKFVIDNSGNPISIPYSANKIQIIKDANFRFNKFIITNLDGVIYEFGFTAVEQTASHINVSGMQGFQYVQTAFFLIKITFPNKENIQFTYSPITITSATGVSQSITRSNGGSVFCLPQHATPCANNTYGLLDTKVTTVNYNTYYLNGISASDGTLVSFNYQNRSDYSGDNRLISIGITSPFGGAGKSFKLEYYDQTAYNANGNNFDIAYSKNTRFFLKGVYQVAQNDLDLPDSLKYTLEYEDINGLPTRLAFSQDHYGFYNGKTNSYYLPTTTDGYTWGGFNQANKSSDWTYAKKGMLKKINYPTGGYDQFEFESNTVPQTQQVSSKVFVTTSGTGVGPTGSNTFTSTITSQFNQTATMTLIASHNMFYWDALNQTPPANDPTKPMTVEFKNITTGVVLYTSIRTVNTTGVLSFSLVAANTYQIKVTVTGEAYHGRSDFEYDPTTGPVPTTVNVATGGVRVKRIESYDPVSNKSINKYFRYHFLADTSVTSGIGTYIAGSGDYINKYGIKTYCSASCSGCYNLCLFETLMSNSAIPLYMYNSNVVVYKAVIESDEPYFKNGGTEHQYFLPETTTGFVVLNNGIKSLPNDTYSHFGGEESQTTVFNNNKFILKRVKNTFKLDSVYNLVTSMSARRNYVHITTSPIDFDDFEQYDASIYNWTSLWIQHDSTITTDYDLTGNSLTTYSIDSFGLKLNTLPVKTETIASDGQKIAVYMKYPNHYPGVTPYQDMISGNRMSPVIEKKMTKNGIQTGLVKTNYNKWFAGTGSSPLVIEPQTVETQKAAGSADSRIRYHAYDFNSNVLEVSKESGLRISYIWDYNSIYPIAEIKNASITLDTIAYTSFEANGKGYWTFSGASSSDFSCPTGSYCYSLVGGSLTRAIQSSKTYIVSYWLKNGTGSVTVNGTPLGGYPKTLTVKNGWTAYEHRITGVATLTISGTATIDEVRLYPVGAFMATYAFKPGIGVVSNSAANGALSRYEYDYFNRLKLVRDGDRNILKQYEYGYLKPFTPCSNTTAAWTATGTVRCVQSGVNNNYTGAKEREEQDLNNCSPTYLQKRWTNITPATGCSQTFCSGEGWRIPTGGSTCVMGQQIFIYQTFNNGVWECKYYYYWPQDGYRGPDIISNDVNVCGVS